MGLFKLTLKTDTTNFERLAEIQARLQDFTAAFANIVGEWADGNRDKFAAGQGAELTGADEPPAHWDPVTTRYYRQKHGPVMRGNRRTYPDWLMVRTGNLQRALTTRGGFAEYIDAHRLIFGAPLDSEAATAAMGNRETRPTVFLGRSDRNMIRREMKRYLTLGDNYRQAIFAASSRRYALLKESAAMDMSFAATVGA